MNKNNNKFLGFNMNKESLPVIVSDSFDAIKNRSKNLVFACANPHSFAVSLNDRDFECALQDADYLVADGIGVLLAGKLVNYPVGPRITGHDYFSGLHNELSKRAVQELGRKGRIFYFGSSQVVLDKIKDNMNSKYSDLEVCGVLSPPFGDWSEEENERMIDEINQARPDVLWVGMTAPKQEKWICENREKLNVPVTGAIGAVFDFFADTYVRSPKWVCKLGVEWIYRLIREPRRMWKRTFISAPMFIVAVVRHHIF